MNIDLVFSLYQRPQTVFSMSELAQLFPDLSAKSLKNRLHYLSKTGKLIKPHHGIYAKPKYEPLELANKLYKPSYISLETVLAKAGVVFQYYQTIFLTSYLTRLVTVNTHKFQYRRLPLEILTNTQGINEQNGYFIATLERAFLDAVYIYKNYHFDNLGVLNWEKLEAYKPIYQSQILVKRLNLYYKLYKQK